MDLTADRKGALVLKYEQELVSKEPLVVQQAQVSKEPLVVQQEQKELGSAQPQVLQRQ